MVVPLLLWDSSLRTSGVLCGVLGPGEVIEFTRWDTVLYSRERTWDGGRIGFTHFRVKIKIEELTVSHYVDHFLTIFL